MRPLSGVEFAQEELIIGTFGISRDVTDGHQAFERQIALAKVVNALAGAKNRKDICRALIDPSIDLTAGSAARGAFVLAGRFLPVIAGSTLVPIQHPSVLEVTIAALAELPEPAQVPPILRRDNPWIFPISAYDHWMGALVLECDEVLSKSTEEDLAWLVSMSRMLIDNELTVHRLHSQLRHLSDGFCLVSPQGMMLFCASSLERAFGYPARHAIGRSLAEFVDRDDLPQLLKAITLPIVKNNQTFAIRWRHIDGSWRHTETIVANLLDDSEEEGIVLMIRDVTERKLLEIELHNAADELRFQATHDSLTGLPNRALIMDRIDQLLARNRRNGTIGAALYVDLDDFKNVNDSLGHEAGDRLLVAVAARMQSTLRDADTIGRMGGDEFVVLIDGGDSTVAPELVAERMLEVMRQPFELAGAPTPLIVNTSIGIAVGDRTTGGELLRDADIALYQAKAEGKDRYEFFRPEMQIEIGSHN